jgi:hypothetical protein
VANVPSGLSLTPTQETTTNNIHPSKTSTQEIQDSSVRKELFSGMSYKSCDLLPDLAAMPI